SGPRIHVKRASRPAGAAAGAAAANWALVAAKIALPISAAAIIAAPIAARYLNRPDARPPVAERSAVPPVPIGEESARDRASDRIEVAEEIGSPETPGEHQAQRRERRHRRTSRGSSPDARTTARDPEPRGES